MATGRAFVSLFILSNLFASLAQAALIPPRESEGTLRIRVRLASALPAVSVRGYDLRILQRGRYLAYAPDRNSEWIFQCNGDRIRATSPTNGKTLELKAPVSVSTPAGLLHFRDRPYRDELRIYSAKTHCEVVNELEIEKYLNGLVNAEFNSKWGEASTEAQVVAARTYALYQMRAVRAAAPSQNYDVDASVRDQVYDGYTSEDWRGSKAVENTRGLVLTVPRANGGYEPLKAFYHSTCAGRTELPQQVWGKPVAGFKRNVVCPFCGSSPRFAWELDLSSRELAEALLRGVRADGVPRSWPKDWVSLLQNGRVADIRPSQKDSSNRWARVSVFFMSRDGRRIVPLSISAVQFRDWMGAARLKSTFFEIAARPGGSWHVYGRGNGHGVGLCQWGAKAMGERGYAMAAILKHYYPDAILRKLW